VLEIELCLILSQWDRYTTETLKTPRHLPGTGTFRARDLSFPRTNSPYGELLFPRLFVPGNFRSLGTKVPWNFRSQALSFSGTFVPGERKFLGTFVPLTFRSEELSFQGLFVPRNFHSSDYLWSPYVIGQTIIFSSCFFFLSFFLSSFFLA